ncbi:MAG: hypothetical protein HKN57_00235 [Xanthomonadales bacterium]|nr:hypothetical protein [Gammaproteobacteria bacterium]MBT8052884.1 hypothetical protein [Gammaproteobacteria bacterium]NND55655.1 hypothetical protein [Xanthomonadales bacterium]NNK49966.1 hypothetical protein [Xanthomonadales bacterium]
MARLRKELTQPGIFRAGLILLVIAASLLLISRLALDGNEPAPVSGSLNDTSLPDRKPASPASTGQNSVAVLPFAVMSNGPDDNYFSDGLTEEIINELSVLPELRVIARTSAFHFRKQGITAREVASRLGVTHVVEGTVHRAGGQLRITAGLIRAADGMQLWSESYDGRTADALAMQVNIARKVALALNAAPDENLRNAMRRDPINHSEAITEYQKGHELYERAHSEVNFISLLRRANAHFEEAVRLAPAFPDAYVRLSDLYIHFLVSQANGELDGNITADDVRDAPDHLRRIYDLLVRYAETTRRLHAEHDRALVLGRWDGISALADHVLSESGCGTADWIHLTGAAFGKSRALLGAYERMAACDPMRARLGVHIAAGSDVHSDSERLIARFMAAAESGDANAARDFQEQFLSRHGPNDAVSLVMEAARGNRNEANRLARLIDSRPFGYMSLLQAIYWCTCGAPFDLDAAPVFSSMLPGSGLPWPPVTPMEFPLKNW